jgi:ATP-dependent protease HslVU (ClpYQ) peptidase subunit
MASDTLTVDGTTRYYASDKIIRVGDALIGFAGYAKPIHTCRTLLAPIEAPDVYTILDCMRAAVDGLGKKKCRMSALHMTRSGEITILDAEGSMMPQGLFGAIGAGAEAAMGAAFGAARGGLRDNTVMATIAVQAAIRIAELCGGEVDLRTLPTLN